MVSKSLSPIVTVGLLAVFMRVTVIVPRSPGMKTSGSEVTSLSSTVPLLSNVSVPIRMSKLFSLQGLSLPVFVRMSMERTPFCALLSTKRKNSFVAVLPGVRTPIFFTAFASESREKGY